MLSGIMVTPQLIEISFPALFIGSYSQLRRYRDPMRCGNGCLHLPGCRFYRPTPDDRRTFASSLAIDAEKIQKKSYIIYKGLLAVGAVATLAPALFYVAYHLRQIRLGFDRCNCNHSKNCPLGVERIVPPPGCETWTYRDRGYDAPNRLEWVPGIRIAASPARVIYLQHKQSERERRRENKRKTRVRHAFGR